MAGVKLQGFREASRQLNEMSKATARNVGKRALQTPAGILRDEMIARVPVVKGDLRAAIRTKPERAYKGRPNVGVIADDIAAVPLEYGNPAGGRFQPAEPFARPSLDSRKEQMLGRFGEALKDEVEKSVIRAAKKAARGR